LRFESGPLLDYEGWSYAVGRIFIDEFHEPFEASLDHWGPNDYAHQWSAAAKRIADGRGPALFLTSYRGPGAAYHFAWPAWREGDRIILQHRLLLTEQLTAPFDPTRPHEVVGVRNNLSEDGDPISQWEVSVAAVQEFVARGPSGSIHVPA
jgi:hypothetical protein